MPFSQTLQLQNLIHYLHNIPPPKKKTPNKTKQNKKQQVHIRIWLNVLFIRDIKKTKLMPFPLFPCVINQWPPIKKGQYVTWENVFLCSAVEFTQRLVENRTLFWIISSGQVSWCCSDGSCKFFCLFVFNMTTWMFAVVCSSSRCGYI